VPVVIAAAAPVLAILGKDPEIIEKLAKVGPLDLITLQDRSHEPKYAKLAWQALGNTEIAVVYEKPIDVAAERERLKKETARLEKLVANDERQLDDEAFLGKAPAPIVEGKRRQLAENLLLLKKAREALDALPPE